MFTTCFAEGDMVKWSVGEGPRPVVNVSGGKWKNAPRTNPSCTAWRVVEPEFVWKPLRSVHSWN